MVAHTFNPSTREAVAGGSLWVWGQSGLQELVPGQDPKLQRNPVLKNQKEKKKSKVFSMLSLKSLKFNSKFQKFLKGLSTALQFLKAEAFGTRHLMCLLLALWSAQRTIRSIFQLHSHQHTCRLTCCFITSGQLTGCYCGSRWLEGIYQRPLHRTQEKCSR